MAGALALLSAVSTIASGIKSVGSLFGGGPGSANTSQNVARSDAQQAGVNVIAGFGDFSFSGGGKTTAGGSTVYTSSDPTAKPQNNMMPLALAAAGGVALFIAMRKGKGGGHG